MARELARVAWACWKGHWANKGLRVQPDTWDEVPQDAREAWNAVARGLILEMQEQVRAEQTRANARVAEDYVRQTEANARIAGAAHLAEMHAAAQTVRTHARTFADVSEAMRSTTGAFEGLAYPNRAERSGG